MALCLILEFVFGLGTDVTLGETLVVGYVVEQALGWGRTGRQQHVPRREIYGTATSARRSSICGNGGTRRPRPFPLCRVKLSSCVRDPAVPAALGWGNDARE